MTRETVRRSVLCPCGGDIYTRTLDNACVRVWRCENCGQYTPRKTVSRRTNHHRAIAAYLTLREAWKATDDALNALVTAGHAAGGAVLVHSSTFNWHLKQLVDKTRPTNFDVAYHREQAQADLARAKQFVIDKQSQPAVR